MHARIRIGAVYVAAFALTTALLLPAAAHAASWPDGVAHYALTTDRVTGANRYATAVSAAARSYPGWSAITYVVIASGEDRASADPLAASGLCWAYDAPLLLVSSTRTPSETRDALRAIAAVNPGVRVVIAGGTTSVPAARMREIAAVVGAGNVEQPWRRGSRYALAAGIAARVRQVATSTGRPLPSAAFVANGESPARFHDALAASAVSRHTGIPVLLTGSRIVPAETIGALRAAGSPEVVVVGGSQSVAGVVFSRLGASARWAGANRFDTAAAIAREASGRGWLDGSVVGLAGTLPDALVGAQLVGRLGGGLLLTSAARVERPAAQFISTSGGALSSAFVFGGRRAISDAQLAELSGAPALPYFSAGKPDVAAGSTTRVAGGVGANTTEVALYSNGSLVATRAVSSFGGFDLGTVTVPTSGTTLELRAIGADGSSTSITRRVVRMCFPYATMILIDKSQYRLYWVRHGELVKSYPIAVGKTNSETPAPSTWKILKKYRTDPGSVYGPRKMRLFRKSGNRFVFTAYGIHGTNQEWVIGTKASHGCVRMYNRDVLELWPQVPLGTMVVIRP